MTIGTAVKLSFPVCGDGEALADFTRCVFAGEPMKRVGMGWYRAGVGVEVEVEMKLRRFRGREMLSRDRHGVEGEDEVEHGADPSYLASFAWHRTSLCCLLRKVFAIKLLP